MASGFSVSETINRPAAVVWAYLTNFNNADRWMDGIDDMIQLTPGRVDVGTGFNFHARGKMHQTEVTAFQDGKLITLTSKQGGMTAAYTYTITPINGEKAEITLDVTCRPSGLLVLFGPLFAWVMKRADGEQMSNLKQAILDDIPA